MTIITKSGQEKKENEANKAKIKAAEAFGPDAQALLQGGDAPVEGQPPLVPASAWVGVGGFSGPGGVEEGGGLEWYVAWRRRRLLSSLCAGLLVTWLLLASVVGGVLLFRYVNRRPVFYGWCGTQYTDEGGFGASRFEKLQERVQVDPNEMIEKIEVPKFGPNRPAVFVHDFKQNVTAIVDVVGRQCFLKPLDRSHVSPPENFIDLINKMESGYYEQNTAVVREKYRVVLPPLAPEALEEEGSFMIAEQCEGSLTFRLERDFSQEILAQPQIDDPIPDDPFAPANQQRSAGDGEESLFLTKTRRKRRSASKAPASFRFFSGSKVVIYDIV